MSEIAEIIDILENKIEKLFSKTDTFEQKNKDLKEQLIQSVKIIQKQSDEIEVLQTQCDSLKMANSLLGSDDNKRNTKLKINSLIRDIDYCIAQLSD